MPTCLLQSAPFLVLVSSSKPMKHKSKENYVYNRSKSAHVAQGDKGVAHDLSREVQYKYYMIGIFR